MPKDFDIEYKTADPLRCRCGKVALRKVKDVGFCKDHHRDALEAQGAFTDEWVNATLGSIRTAGGFDRGRALSGEAARTLAISAGVPQGKPMYTAAA